MMQHSILVYVLSGYGLFVAAALYLWWKMGTKNNSAPPVQTPFNELLHAEQVLKHAYEYLERHGYSSVGGLLLQKRRDVVAAMMYHSSLDEVLSLGAYPPATDCTRQVPHLCTVNGPCNGFPKLVAKGPAETVNCSECDTVLYNYVPDAGLGKFQAAEGLNGRMPTHF